MRSLSANVLLIIVLLITSVLYVHRVGAINKNFIYSDYGKFYQSLRFALAGKNPYTSIYYLPEATTKEPHPVTRLLGGNLNPPFFNVLLLPLGLLSYVASLYTWQVISIISGILGVVLLKKALDSTENNTSFATLSLMTAFFIYYPVYANVWLGQVALCIFPLLTGAWLAAQRGFTGTAGTLLAIATSIKLFFGLFLLYFLLRREWRGLSAFIATLLVCHLLPLIIFGKFIYVNYQKTLTHVVWYASSWNASLYGFLLRLFSGAEKNVPLWTLPKIVPALYAALAGVIVLAVLKFLQPAQPILRQQKIALDFSILIVAMFLLAPLGWMYYFAYLFVPVIVLLMLAHQGYYPYSLRLLTCAAVVLTSLPYGLKTPIEISGALFIVGWAASNTYGLLLLFGLLCFMRYQLSINKMPIHDNCPSYLAVLLYICALLPSCAGIIAATYNFTGKPLTTPPEIKQIYFGDMKHADLPAP